MIVCGVKSFTHNGHKVHEIDLKCHSCDSQFVLTAAHDCEAGDDNDDDGDRGEGEGDLLALREGKEEEEEGVLNGEVGGGGLVGATNEGTTGLEWLTNGEISLVNMII